MLLPPAVPLPMALPVVPEVPLLCEPLPLVGPPLAVAGVPLPMVDPVVPVPLVEPVVPVVEPVVEPVVPVAVPVERVVPVPVAVLPVVPVWPAVGPDVVGLLLGEPEAPPWPPALVPEPVLPDCANAPPQANAAAAERARILKVCLM